MALFRVSYGASDEVDSREPTEWLHEVRVCVHVVRMEFAWVGPFLHFPWSLWWHDANCYTPTDFGIQKDS